MDFAEDIHRLRTATRSLAWFLALLIAYLAWGGFKGWIDSTMHELRVRQDEKGFKLLSNGDGPFVVFALTVKADYSDSEKKTATLSPPLVIVDSAGGFVDMKGLKWVDVLGEPTSAPTSEMIQALYVRPLATKEQSAAPASSK